MLFLRTVTAALCGVLIASATPLLAQTAPVAAPAAAQASAPLKARADELPGVLTGTVAFESYFAPSFVAQVPKAKFDAITAQLTAANGPVQGVERLEGTTPHSGLVTLGFRDAVASIQLTVEPAAPHRVSGLVVTGLSARAASLDAVAASLRELQGTTGFTFAKLGDGAPELRVRHNADRPFAIGSAFKLVILAELVRATNKGERRWDDTVTLDGAPLPGGAYFLKPVGTRVSLRELAAQMISVSDNSATDILLKALGRERVEAMMPVLGIRDPARSRPFLGTLEAFKLKGIGKGALAERYRALDEAGRRAMLAGEVAAARLTAIDPMLFRDGKPVRIEELEWFQSPADLVHVMDWLRRNTEGPSGAEARAILSKNPGISMSAAQLWQWVGYKGGSEPGVINMTLLLQAKGGAWYVLTGSWNDPAAAVDDSRFAALIIRAAELAAR